LPVAAVKTVILQYNLTGLSGRTIDGATLEIDINTFTGSTEDVLIGGFADTAGAISPFTDFNSPPSQLALFTPTTLGPTVINLSPGGFIDSVVQGSGILGIRFEATNTANFSFDSAEGAALFGSKPATLTLSTVPEPSTTLACAILFSGV